MNFAIYNLIKMIIYVKKQLRHSHFKSVESEKKRFTKHNEKVHLYFVVSIWRFHNFRHILQIPKFK